MIVHKELPMVRLEGKINEWGGFGEVDGKSQSLWDRIIKQ